MDFDVIIIGGGPAGLSAALWCDELGLKTALLEAENEFGGQLLWTFNSVENYLGLSCKNGRELRDRFLAHMSGRGFLRFLQATAREADVKKKIVTLSDGKKYSGKAIVISTGVRRRKLGVDGEESFLGKGVLVSGKRDGQSVAGQTVAVVGGGDAAIENALILAKFAKKVLVVHRRDELSARPEFAEKLKYEDNIEVLYNTELTKIYGGQIVQGVELERDNFRRELDVEGVLIRIGVAPNSEFLKGQLELDVNGYIKIDSLGKTNVDNVFAVGDISNPVSPTINSAVGMGATAAKTIYYSLSS